MSRQPPPLVTAGDDGELGAGSQPRAAAATGQARRPRRLAPWPDALLHGAVAYVVSRAMVIVAAGLVAAAQQPRPLSARGPIVNVLTSWDGLWYFEIVRHGYPASVPPNVTYFDLPARTAFFPLFPLLVRAADVVLPGGDVFAALVVNAVLGALVVLAVGLLARKLAGDQVAKRAMVLTALFPGSFVLSFAYSEALMILLAALVLLFLLERRWLLAGVAAALTTACRPNGLSVVAACTVAAFLAWRRDRKDWRPWIAPVLAPLGFVAFQVYLWRHTGEPKVWFRVQREAWNEGASFGWTALKEIGEFLAHPLGSATTALTTLCALVTVVGLVALRRARLGAPIAAYTLVALAFMLLPATVTARPRFVFTAFPLLIAVAKLWPDDREDWWAMLLAACGAGLVAVTAIYGLYAAIP